MSARVAASPDSAARRIATIDALILAELDRCDRLGVEPGAEHMRLVSERRAVATGGREATATEAA